jgi:Leucine-rich repeat (LRR) protein
LCHLTNLKKLVANGNKISSLSHDMSAFSLLETVNFEDNCLTAVADVSKNHALTNMFLSNNKV